MPRRILLIDDDRLQMLVVQGLLRKMRGDPYALDWADSYVEGLRRLESGAYAACLLDFRLGDRDGLELIHEAVAGGCRTPIIFLTAETATKVDLAAMDAGALDYLVKGEITPTGLERSLRYALKLGETLEALRVLATHDALTGLLNRREFDRLLAEECQRAARFGHPLSLVIADIDHFKAINDAHGHPGGDAVLREIGRRMHAAARNVDRVARIGGEEFAFLLMETDQEGALRFARRMCEAIPSAPIPMEGASLTATVSAGAAVHAPGDSSGAALFAAADRALYAAKLGGRNRVACAWLPA